MLNDYKPTQDPNTDTFKVQYLLGFSALLAILFPQQYTISEVSLYFIWDWPNTLTSFLERFSGHSQSGWNPLRSCRNYSCYNEPARQILLQPTTSLRWVYIEHYIFPTGFTDFSSRAFSMRFPFLLELSRPSSTQTFSTSITRSKSYSDCISCSLSSLWASTYTPIGWWKEGSLLFLFKALDESNAPGLSLLLRLYLHVHHELIVSRGCSTDGLSHEQPVTRNRNELSKTMNGKRNLTFFLFGSNKTTLYTSGCDIVIGE